MQGKKLIDMSVAELAHALVRAEVPLCQLNWTMVADEAAKARVIEARIADGYTCECGDGPEECLAATTLVVGEGVGATPEHIEQMREHAAEVGRDDYDADIWAEAEPLVIFIARGDSAMAVAHSPMMMIAALAGGVHPAEVTQAAFEEKLEQAEVAVVSDVDEFLRGLGMSDETTSDEAGQ